MIDRTPVRRLAGMRESGVVCPHCQSELRVGDDTAVCADCGAPQHWSCWQRHEGCGEYECSSGRRGAESTQAADVLRVSIDDLSRATPIQPRPTFAVGPIPVALRLDADSFNDGQPKRWNKLAVTAIVLSVLGIPLFGLVTGLFGILFGCLALAGQNQRLKGTGIAIAAIVLGIVDVVGWTIGLGIILGGGAGGLTMQLDQFEPDPAALKQLPPHTARAMAANVLIHTAPEWSRLRGEGIGSGVVLKIENGSALIVTNRHVVDHHFAEQTSAAIPAFDKLSQIDIKVLGQPARPASVLWIAPKGIDLALVRVPVSSDEIQAAEWDRVPSLKVGADVFAVGNPHGLGWSLTRGSLSQVRLNDLNGNDVKVIQTSAAINPGNSGGGLYDQAGKLIGINTWTKDKRVAEGLSFAITFTTLLELVPAEHGLQ